MRHIPPALQTKLDSGVTTLCHAWIIERQDLLARGYTNHDRNLTLEGVVCEAQTGLEGSEMSERLGLSITGGEIEGGLIHDNITESDIEKGLYDNAKVSLYLVDWSEPTLFVLLRCGIIGEITRQGATFKAEIRSLATQLDEERGRHYTLTCNADFGDARCGLNLADPAYHLNAALTSLVSANTFYSSALAPFSTNLFTGGKLTFTSGANSGASFDVLSHSAERLILWQTPAELPAIGDEFHLTAGCDKRFSTCKSFNNSVNFRGFPHIPGNDFLHSYPLPGESGHTGGRL